MTASNLVPISKRALPQMIEGIDPNEVQALITRPVLTHEQGTAIQIKFLSPMVQRQRMNKETGEFELGPHVAVVQERQSLDEYLYVCNIVTASQLEENFPEKSYVGKIFAILKEKPAKGGQYCAMKIALMNDNLF